MTDEELCMHLTYYLLNKFCNNSIKIPIEEWNSIFGGNKFIVKHRMHNGSLEVMALENKEQ